MQHHHFCNLQNVLFHVIKHSRSYILWIFLIFQREGSIMFQFWIYDDLYFFTIQLFLYITWNSAIKTNFLLIANKIDFIFCSCRFNISLCRNKISVICFLSGYNCLYMYLFCISICIFIRIRPFAFNIFFGSCSSIFLFYTYFLFRCCYLCFYTLCFLLLSIVFISCCHIA